MPDSKRWDDELRMRAGRMEITHHPKGSEILPATDEDEAAPPDLEGEYKPYCHLRAKTVPAMRVYFNAEGRRKYGKSKRQFQMCHLDDDDAKAGMADDGTWFALVFSGQVTQRLIVRGRNLVELFDFIADHKIAWLRAVERDFEKKGECVITSIEIEAVEEERAR
jgi:hypothetical protein